MKEYSRRITAIKILKYCPVCTSKIEKREVIDILVYGLMCKNNHSYFVPLKEVWAKHIGGK